MPHKPRLGQGHNQKKDTHTLDFDVTLEGVQKDLTNRYAVHKNEFLTGA